MHEARWAEAEGELRHLVAAHPSLAPAQYLLAETLFHENKAKESLAAYTRAAQLAPPSALDFQHVALDYVLLGAYPEADKWMTRSVHDDPKNAETWYDLGRIRQTDNRFTEAIACFEKALALAPRSVKAETNLGLAYEGLNRPEDAMAAYRQAIAWQASEPHPSEQPFLDLGMLLTDRNQLDEALAALKRAAALSPADPKIHGALGKLYVRRAELGPAAMEFEQALRGDPGNAGFHFQLGQVYRRQNLPERANAELQRAAALEAQGRH